MQYIFHGESNLICTAKRWVNGCARSPDSCASDIPRRTWSNKETDLSASLFTKREILRYLFIAKHHDSTTLTCPMEIKRILLCLIHDRAHRSRALYGRNLNFPSRTVAKALGALRQSVEIFISDPLCRERSYRALHRPLRIASALPFVT